MTIANTLCGILKEIMEQLVNTPFEIEVMRGGTLKLVKMQAANAPLPMLSMPSWRRIDRMAAAGKGTFLNFHEHFTQLHLV